MEEGPQNDTTYLLNDFSTRLKDIEEKSKTNKERVVLFSKNLIDFKEEAKEELRELKTTVTKTSEDVEKMKNIINALVNETGKYVKTSQMLTIERMLKDFQPLEFVRMIDLERVVNEKIKENKKK
jgi:hypothetical protein